MSKQFIITDENGYNWGNATGYDYFEDAAEAAANSSHECELHVRDTWNGNSVEGRFFHGASLTVRLDNYFCEPDESMDGDFDSGMAAATSRG